MYGLLWHCGIAPVLPEKERGLFYELDELERAVFCGTVELNPYLLNRKEGYSMNRKNVRSFAAQWTNMRSCGTVELHRYILKYC